MSFSNHSIASPTSPGELSMLYCKSGKLAQMVRKLGVTAIHSSVLILVHAFHVIVEKDGKFIMDLILNIILIFYISLSNSIVVI